MKQPISTVLITIINQEIIQPHFLTKLADNGGTIIPDPTVETETVIFQLVQDFLHFKRGQNVLYQYTGLYGASWQGQLYIT